LKPQNGLGFTFNSLLPKNQHELQTAQFTFLAEPPRFHSAEMRRLLRASANDGP